jgi:tripartite-type tricarboxylate transporter receptor subunit TctC
MRALLVAGLTSFAVFLPHAGSAQGNFPTKPVRLIVPFLAGAAPDSVARIVGAELSRRMGQPFIVENRTGAGGSIAAEFVAKSPPDGYTLFSATDAPLVINPHVYAKIGYDTIKDFTPISIIAKSGFYMLVCPKLQVSNLSEFVALAKKRPLSYASSGNGSNHHLIGEMLKQRGGFDMNHVPYRGASAALIDIMNCNVDTGFVAVASILQQVKAGAENVKPIAITAPQREPETPNIPTINESGFPGVEMEAYYALLAPRATPQPVVDLLAAEVAAVLKTKDVTERLKGIGLTIVGSTPKEFATRINADLEKYGKLVKEVNLRVQ